MADKLNEESIQGWIESRRGWKLKDRSVTKEFKFPSFRSAIVFVNRIATLADEQNHHPDIDVRYDMVRIALTTHDAGGITENDLRMAEQIDFATSAR
jgi:4a-hydroxytetrahydrobiopterin dehydratase